MQNRFHYTERKFLMPISFDTGGGKKSSHVITELWQHSGTDIQLILVTLSNYTEYHITSAWLYKSVSWHKLSHKKMNITFIIFQLKRKISESVKDVWSKNNPTVGRSNDRRHCRYPWTMKCRILRRQVFLRVHNQVSVYGNHPWFCGWLDVSLCFPQHCVSQESSPFPHTIFIS